MSATPLTYVLPGLLSSDQFVSQLSTKLPLAPAAQQSVVKTFYDSFDWRLYKAGMTLEFNQSKQGSVLSLMNIRHPQTLMAIEIMQVPKFADEFTRLDFRKQLQLVLEMRALLPVATLNYQHTLVNILNADQKTVLRLSIDAYENLPGRVNVHIIKGYDKKVLSVLALLQSEFALQAPAQPLLLEALKIRGKTAGDYSSKLRIHLDPDMRADIASKYIYSYLLNIMQFNVQGCIDNIDSEFLHDFRVAVRRTRAGLSQIKQVLPKNSVAYFADFFSWLGQITGSVRDIDVYLLNFEAYKSSLPISCREDLEPLRAFLLDKQQNAYVQLAQQLSSPRYIETLAEWQEFLKAPVVKSPVEMFATVSIKDFADRRLWKLYKHLLREAHAIDAESPAAVLHSLRKTAKKLRYLMEFFQTLYPESSIKLLLKSLKAIQEVLGQFQDYEVQKLALKRFSQEMRSIPVPMPTLLAMELLIQELEQRKNNVRLAFSLSFETFSQKKNQQAVKALFAPGKKAKSKL